MISLSQLILIIYSFPRLSLSPFRKTILLASYVVLFGIYTFFVNWLATLNGNISLLQPSCLISHCYVVFLRLIIVSVWYQIKLHFNFIS